MEGHHAAGYLVSFVVTRSMSPRVLDRHLHEFEEYVGWWEVPIVSLDECLGSVPMFTAEEVPDIEPMGEMIPETSPSHGLVRSFEVFGVRRTTCKFEKDIE